MDASEEETVFDAVLTPHRSLGRTGFRLLMGGLVALSTLLSVPFFLLGAWPVVGFFGLDVALLYFFFRINYAAAAREQERLLLTHMRLLFSRIDPRGRRREWSFNPAWVRLDRQDHEEFGVMRLALTQRGHSVEIARCLGAGEKAEFAEALTGAIAQARAGRRFNR